jgi:hypothetical protein
MSGDFELVADVPCSMTVDCVDFWLDGPGDHTVRPCRPEHLEHVKAERAKIEAALAAKDQSESNGRK